MKNHLLVASHQQRTVQRSAKRKRKKDRGRRRRRRRRREASERGGGLEMRKGCIDRGLLDEEQGKMILMCV